MCGKIKKLTSRLQRLSNRLLEKNEVIQIISHENQLLNKKIEEHVCECLTCKEQLIDSNEGSLTCKVGLSAQGEDCPTCEERQKEIDDLEEALVKAKDENAELLMTIEMLKESKAEEKIMEVKAVREEYKKTFTRPGLEYHVEEASLTVTPQEKEDIPDATPEVKEGPKVTCDRSCARGGKFPQSGKTYLKKQKPMSCPTKESVALKAGKTYQIWRKQYMNSKGAGVDFYRRKRRATSSVKKSKVVHVREQRMCWHCEKLGHFRKECPELRKLQGRVCPMRDITAYYRKRLTPRLKVDLKPAKISQSITSDIFVKHILKPSKPKLVWVPKN